jgi:hypothetical protein
MDCFQGEWQEVAWVSADKNARSFVTKGKDLVYEPFFCKDCTPSYAYTMRLQGKCQQPQIKFRYDDNEGFIGYDPVKEYESHVKASETRKKNAPEKVGKTSKYRGVCWSKARSMWHVRIHHHHKHYSIGFFTDEVEAAKAYTDAWERIKETL